MDRVYQRIRDEILDDIVTGEIRPAEWLPRVDDLAARHACSPNAAREAIRALEERHVIEVHAGQGQQVLDSDEWTVLDHDVAAAALLRHRDPELLREAIDALRLIEVQAVLLAVPRMGSGDLTLLEQTLEQMRESSRGGNGARDLDDRFSQAEASFHRALVVMSRNRFLASSLRWLHPVLVAARRQRSADRDPVVVALHETIVAALAERDPMAAAAAIETYCQHLASWMRA